MDQIRKIKENNRTHSVNETQLKELLVKAQSIYQENFDNSTHFERSVFINWTCAIADCKYCYLSTKPKYNPKEGTKAVRSQESVLAEVLICKIMKWRIGYITGGLRVESVEYLQELLTNIEKVTGEKTIMNFGPYTRGVIEKLHPHIKGMGSAIESFDEELHNFICPSKPLKSLLKFLTDVNELGLEKFITIILGVGERKQDIDVVIENIKKYDINKVQLCFLKPQENTIFDDVPPPNPNYMAWWIANLRIACPQIQINVALVRERISDVALYLNAGANGFTRFMVFSDFAGELAHKLVNGCSDAKRELQGNFLQVPDVNLKQVIDNLPLDPDLKAKILPKAQQYYDKLSSLQSRSR